MLLGALGYCWVLLDVVGGSWLLSGAAVGCCWVLLDVIGCCWMLLGAVGGC